MCNTGNEIVICQLQNGKSNFPMFCKAYSRQNSKINLIHLHYGISRNHCFNFSFKSRFQEAFLVKVIYTKKYTVCT